MSDVALRTSPPVAGRRLAEVGRQTLLGVAEGIAAARRYARLSAMSDRDLAPLGLSREDVPRFAVFGDPRAR